MREIKFRVWDKELNKMFYADAEQLDNGFAFLIDGHLDDETPVWMQCTGCKDINGTGIYEGDILLTKDIEGEKYQTCVTYENGMFLSGEESLYDDVVLFEAEVVGNIYENPELLTV